MNKIIIDNEEVIKSDLDYSYNKKENVFDISELMLNINDSKDLSLYIKTKEDSRLVISFNIMDNTNLNVYIITEGKKSKIQYKYNLGKKATCKVEKLNIVDGIREMVITNLKESSNFKYVFKSITVNSENYDYMIYHDGENSTSNIINNCINESGSIYLQISSFIPEKIKGCSTNQYNRIINNTNNKCEIKPNLYIDCDDVNANHSALIDKFNNNELFYLQSRGIDKKTSIKILSKGFLLSNISNKQIIDLINKRYGGE